MSEVIKVEDLGGLHWSKLKSLVEQHGGAYEGKEQAIAFLTAKLATADTAPADTPAGGDGADTVTGDAAPDVVEAAKGEPSIAFDKRKPYGDVFGEIENAPGARYFQGGKYFNGRGELVG